MQERYDPAAVETGAQADWEAYMAGQEDCAAYDRHVAQHQVAYVPAGWDACVKCWRVNSDQAAFSSRSVATNHSG